MVLETLEPSLEALVMVARKEQELLLQQKLRRQLLRGQIDRREFLSRTLTAGLGLAGVSVASNYGIGPARAERPLTPTFYDWIGLNHPGIAEVNARFEGIDYQIAPVEGFGIERFVAEAKKG
jgi:multiple sugar transport system substrate-binding protein